MIVSRALERGVLAHQASGKELVMTDWQEFGYESYIYLLSPAAAAEKKYNQTHNVEGAGQAVFAPVNYLNVANGVASPGSQLFVTPNINVIYASAHLELTETNALVNTTPNVNENWYCVWEIMDAFMNVFAYIGSTPTVEGEPVLPVGGNYCFTGPHSQQEPPQGYGRIPCPTNDVWVVARYFVQPESTDEQVSSLYNTCPLGPQGDFPPVNRDWNPNYYRQVSALNITDVNGSTFDPATMYSVMNVWLTANGWGPSTNEFQEKMLSYGLGPNQLTDWNSVVSEHPEIFTGIKAASDLINASDEVVSTRVNNWLYSIDPATGNYGTNYLLRSVIARGGLGANKLSQCVYAASLNAEHEPDYDANNIYQFTIPSEWFFDVSSLPYVSPGFWSITVYVLTGDDAGRLPETVGEALPVIYQPGPTLRTDSEGNAVVILSKEPLPTPSSFNWLPLPSKEEDKTFYLIFRVYAPQEKMYRTPQDPPAYPWSAPVVTMVSNS